MDVTATPSNTHVHLLLSQRRST